MADIQYLIDRLEDLLNQGFRIPMTTNAVIDEDAFLDILDQLRITVPNEIREAQRIIQERDRIVEEARDEAERIVAEARLEANQLVEDSEISEQARARADEIRAEAHREADEIRRGADQYAADVLHQLESQLAHFLDTVHNGLDMLEQDDDAFASQGTQQEGAGATPQPADHIE